MFLGGGVRGWWCSGGALWGVRRTRCSCYISFLAAQTFCSHLDQLKREKQHVPQTACVCVCVLSACVTNFTPEWQHSAFCAQLFISRTAAAAQVRAARRAAAAAAAAAIVISAVSCSRGCVLRERAASGTLCVPLHPVSALKFRSACFLESSTFNPAKASYYLRTDRLRAAASYYCKSAYQLKCWLAFRNITFGIVTIRSSIYTSQTSPHAKAQHDHTASRGNLVGTVTGPEGEHSAFDLSVYPSVCLSIYGISVSMLLLLLRRAGGLVCCYITSDTQNVLNRSFCTNTVEPFRCLEELHTQQECLSEHSVYNPVKLLADRGSARQQVAHITQQGPIKAAVVMTRGSSEMVQPRKEFLMNV